MCFRSLDKGLKTKVSECHVSSLTVTKSHHGVQMSSSYSFSLHSALYCYSQSAPPPFCQQTCGHSHAQLLCSAGSCRSGASIRWRQRLGHVIPRRYAARRTSAARRAVEIMRPNQPPRAKWRLKAAGSWPLPASINPPQKPPPSAIAPPDSERPGEKQMVTQHHEGKRRKTEFFSILKPWPASSRTRPWHQLLHQQHATCNMQLCSLGLPLSNSQIDISSYVTSMLDKAVLLVIGIVSREDLSDKFVSLASSARNLFYVTFSIVPLTT